MLKGQSQLVTSVTATGKTLVAEMAGIENILKKKVVYSILFHWLPLQTRNMTSLQKDIRPLASRLL
ncbi:MAG: hypothetical protein R2741_13125 [Methanolobus sp.]